MGFVVSVTVSPVLLAVPTSSLRRDNWLVRAVKLAYLWQLPLPCARWAVVILFLVATLITGWTAHMGRNYARSGEESLDSRHLSVNTLLRMPATWRKDRRSDPKYPE